MKTSARSLRSHQDKRRFQRVEIELSGRYMLPSKVEDDCRVIEMSPGSMAVAASRKASVGDDVVLYIEKLGRFNGRVERLTPDGFALAVDNSRSRRERLADTLTWFANKDLLTQEDESRGSERVVPFIRRTILKRADQKETLAKIVDVSCVGVALETELRPAIGEDLTVGKTQAKVVRHFVGGIACAFLTPFQKSEIDESAVL